MARDEQSPVFLAAFDLVVHVEEIVRRFGRHHSDSFGPVLRQRSRAILERITAAESSAEPQRALLLGELRAELETFKGLARLCHEAGGFASTRSYLEVVRQVAGITRQSEDWLAGRTKAGVRAGGARRGQRNTQAKGNKAGCNRPG